MESSNQIPEGDTIGKLYNLLIKNHIHEQSFALEVKILTEWELILKQARRRLDHDFCLHFLCATNHGN